MKIRAFLHFPENEIALAELSNNEQLYDDILSELSSIKKHLKSGEYDLYYDSDNILSFLNVADQFIESDTERRRIKKSFQTFISSKSINVESPKHRFDYCMYANWFIDLNVVPSPRIIQESSELWNSDDDNHKTVCICLGNSMNTKREELHVIKDMVHQPDLPELRTIPAVGSDIEFIKWMITLPSGKFKLQSNPDFEPLEKFWGKQRIYKKRNGEYWYFDFFHRENKIHYEVFDNTGNHHLGEANEDGVILPGTADANKKISDTLN